MQFTQFTQLQSLQENSHNLEPYQCEMQTLTVQPYLKQFSSILEEIHEINCERSISCSIMAEMEVDIGVGMDMHVQEGQEKEYFGGQDNDDIFFTPSKILTNQSRRSTIFTATRSTDGNPSSTTPSPNTTGIQVYYFGQPIYKYIPYDKVTTIETLISRALSTYTMDYSLDQNWVTSMESRCKLYCNVCIDWEMRFVKEEGSYLADYEVEAVGRDRVLGESMFEVLVLVRVCKDSKNNSSSRNKISDNRGMEEKANNSSNSEGQVKLNIFNEANIHISTIIISKNETLGKAIQFLQAQLNEKIVLLEYLESELPLPEHMDIRNLSSYKIYVKKRRYLDQPENEKIPLKIISSVPKDLTVSFTPLPPIGITQASRYQEFQVIKINRRGIEQPRIIGFDQTKYYNYDVSLRKKNKQASFLSVFIGNNILTGTKKPERLISEIEMVNELEGNNFQIVLNDKKIEFKTDTIEKKERILRKLRFLIEFNKKKDK